MRIAYEYPFNFKVVRSRSSKSGDFRASYRDNPARITINGDLNPYAFLITLVHELAHYVVYIDFSVTPFPGQRKSRRPQPHGEEWKNAFRELMAPFLYPHIIPPDLLFHLANYLKNPRASSTGDQHLMRALRKYDRNPEGIHLEELPFNTLFRIHNGMIFRKKEKLRTRFTCIHQHSGRTYRISPLAEVTPIEEKIHYCE